MGHEALETQRAAAGPGPGLRAGLAFALSCPEDSWVVAMYPWQVSDGGDICSLIATRSGLKAVSPEVLNIWAGAAAVEKGAESDVIILAVTGTRQTRAPSPVSLVGSPPRCRGSSARGSVWPGLTDGWGKGLESPLRSVTALRWLV